LNNIFNPVYFLYKYNIYISTLQPSNNENIAPKLKSIIVTSRLRLGSQDSSEKHVTFQDSNSNNTDFSSIKIKKVKFADDTIFEQEDRVKRG
jgi:hypothetical protein